MRSGAGLLALSLALLLDLNAVAAHATDAPTLRADGGGFVLTLADAQVLRSEQLVGATLSLSDGQRVRIDAVQAQPDPKGQPLWLHSLSVQDASGQWQPYCSAHLDGTRLALVLPGHENADGTLTPDPERLVITCTAGAQGKCLRFGYRPWTHGRGYDDYNACIRMVRADYGGDGHPYTVDGMTIDLYDDGGVQTPDLLPSHTFEAGWSAQGAVCVHHVRVAANTSLEQLQTRYPALRGRTGPVCTEALARSLGARAFNRSSPAGTKPTVPGTPKH